MQRVFLVGDEPIPGYRLVEDMGGSAFYKLWKVRTKEGEFRQWKVIDMVVGNAAIETRTLGLLVQIRHPRLSTLTNFWQVDEGKVLIVESDLPTMTMRNRFEQCQKLGQVGIPATELAEYTAQAAEALDFLNAPRHQFQGQQVAVYHRSLRPECLLLYQQGNGYTCRVSDFGLAKPVTEETAQHSQGLVHYDYDPPEFFEGQTAPSSDQYALAINYYEMRTGKLPFQGTMLEQLQARLNDSPDITLIDEPERGVVRKGLARDPANRYANCMEFARALKMALGVGGSKSVAVAAAAAGPPPTRQAGGQRKSTAGTPNLAKTNPPQDRPPSGPPLSRPPSGPPLTAGQGQQGVVYHKRPDGGSGEHLKGGGQPAQKPTPSSGSKPDMKAGQQTDLKSIRQQLSGQTKAKKAAVDDSLGEETRLPVWLVLVVVVLLIGLVAGTLWYMGFFGGGVETKA